MSNTENKTVVITSVTSKKLSSELVQHENCIRTCQKSFIELGEHLRFIHDMELFKERGFNSWEKYIAEMFDITRDYSYKIMNSYSVILILKDAGYKGHNLPKTESQARPMARLLDEDKTMLVSVWADVTSKGNRITAQRIQESVNKALGKGEPTSNKKKDTKETPAVPNNTGSIDQAPANKAEVSAELDKMIAHNIELTQKLETVKRDTVEIPRNKLAIKLYKAGFKVMSASIDKSDKEAVADLLDLKAILLG